MLILLLVTVIYFCLKHQRQSNHTVYATKIILCDDFYYIYLCTATCSWFCF